MNFNTCCIVIAEEYGIFSISENVFKGLPTNYQVYNGIEIYNSKVYIHSNLPNNKPYNFKDLSRGISYITPYLAKTGGQIGSQKFQNCRAPIDILSLDDFSIDYCSFEEDDKQYYWQGAGMADIQCIAASNIYISNNIAYSTKNRNSSTDPRSFVAINSSGSFASDIFSNEIEGKYTYGSRLVNNNPGLQIGCNDFIDIMEMDIY